MKGKFLTALISAALFSVFGTALAGAQESLVGLNSGGDVIFSDIQGDVLVLNGYNDGILCGSIVLKSDNGSASVSADKINEFETVRAWDSAKDEPTAVTFKEPTVTMVPLFPVPEPTETAAPSPSPTPSAASEYNPHVYPDVYGSELNAYYAPSVIENVSATVENGEDGYTITYLTKGEEYESFVGSDVTITASNDLMQSIIGLDASALSKGDTVYLNRDTDGIKSIGFICRAPSKSLLLDGNDYGTDFEKYIAHNRLVADGNGWNTVSYSSGVSSAKYQYAFGLVGNRNSRTLYLMNGSASIDNALETLLSDDTIVYTYDVSGRGGVEVGTISSITSNFPRSEWNKGGTVEYTADNTASYVLLRIVEGTVTDAVLYML